MPISDCWSPLNLLPLGDTHFEKMFRATLGVQCIDSSCRWTEGPVYLPSLMSVVWSDIPNNRMLRWHIPSETTSIFRAPSNFANGNYLDAQGRLLSCEHGSRSVIRHALGQPPVVLASAWKGKRLNSPNDVVEAQDGGVWFTDPTYGIDSDYEGYRAESEIGACHVYRIDPLSGYCQAMITDMVRPNGIAFSPDASRLYVSDTGGTHFPQGPRHIRVFTPRGAKGPSGGQIFAECDNGYFDGFRVDARGRLWTSAGDGVHCYSPDGVCLGKIVLAQAVANLAFGGAWRDQLFVCATHCVYRIHMAYRWES